MTPTENCYRIARHFESCRLSAYPDPFNPAIYTIAWGRTANVRAGDQCDQETADRWLSEDMETAGAIVERYAPSVNQMQFDALTDFCYNVGPGIVGIKDGLIWLKQRDAQGRGQHSTLLRLTIEGDYGAAGAEFDKWDHAGGKEVKGLLARRDAERQLYAGIVPQLS